MQSGTSPLRRSPRKAPRHSAMAAMDAEKENRDSNTGKFDFKQRARSRQSLPSVGSSSSSSNTTTIMHPPVTAARRAIAPRKSALKATMQSFPSPTGLAPDPLTGRWARRR